MAEATTRWRCPECHDEMDARFQRSHVRICELMQWAAADAVDALLDDLGLAHG